MSELVALKTVKAFNDLASRAAAKGSETLSLMWKAGEVAKKAKESIPHGEWMKFVETHYDVTHSTVTRWIQFRENVPESKLCTVHNLNAGIKMLDPPKETRQQTPPKPGNVAPEEGDEPAEFPPQDAVDAGIMPPPAAESGTERRGPSNFIPVPDEDEDDVVAPDDKCPACAGTKWELGPEGWACSKCNQPAGEPAGDPDDDRVSTLRSKTRKTTEALMRCFDDLHHICPSYRHQDAIQWCKSLLQIAREWK